MQRPLRWTRKAKSGRQKSTGSGVMSVMSVMSVMRPSTDIGDA